MIYADPRRSSTGSGKSTVCTPMTYASSIPSTGGVRQQKTISLATSTMPGGLGSSNPVLGSIVIVGGASCDGWVGGWGKKGEKAAVGCVRLRAPSPSKCSPRPAVRNRPVGSSDFDQIPPSANPVGADTSTSVSACSSDVLPIRSSRGGVLRALPASPSGSFDPLLRNIVLFRAVEYRTSLFLYPFLVLSVV